MRRSHIINLIGQNYLTSNIENEEFSYHKAFNNLKQNIPQLPEEYYLINYREPFKLDIRFENNGLSILVETKGKFTEKDFKQLEAYIWWEKQYRPKNKIIAILADTEEESKRAKIWKDGTLINDDEINTFEYYEQLYNKKTNDKLKVLKTTNELNNLLHKFAIKEKHRSQFVGSCLVALNNNLKYSEEITTKEILDRISARLDEKLNDNENKKTKIDILKDVLKQQDIKELKVHQICQILNIIDEKLIPFINEKTNEGEDLLNLFFTTFNKYTGKADKNQAFTPTHITDFMTDLVHLTEDSNVLDITCGSGAFLIQAMKKMLALTSSQEKKKEIKSNQIYGIEREENAFGLATTNMLIHQDGKSNIICADCFDKKEWIKQKNINAILMNPPFNAQKMPSSCPQNNKGMDSTKGFYFVNWVADVVNQGYLCTILPLSCAIGTSTEIAKYKKKMLEKHTLEAVFSLPNEIFYPGASASTCIMLFKLGTRHDPQTPTFFGYFKDDGFEKRKNLGRVEIKDWNNTKTKWLKAFKENAELEGFSVKHKVTWQDEWLAEAYMKTDYSKLTEEDFIQSIRDFISYKVKNGSIDHE